MRSKRGQLAELPDPRVWDNEPLQWQRWVKKLEVTWNESELLRDEAWGREHGWAWAYFLDGSKEATTRSGAVVRFPSRESLGLAG